MRRITASRLTTAQSPGLAVTVPAAHSAGLAGWWLNVTRASQSPFTGAGVKIALLDSGFERPHPDFGARSIVGHSFVAGESPRDLIGHGTHCGALTCGPRTPTQYPRYGIAGSAAMWVLKVIARNAVAQPHALMAGIETAIQNRCEIVCIAIAEKTRRNAPHSPEWEQLAQRALATGTLILAACGNHSDRVRGLVQPVGHPANCPSVVAVGAVDRQMQVAPFSNGGASGGKAVDLVAPGVDVFSAFPGPRFYALMSGTSQAVALAAGIAALHAEKTGLRGDALRTELLRTAQPLAAATVDVGAGLVQAPL
jgi:subtilisin family serine protease